MSTWTDYVLDLQRERDILKAELVTIKSRLAAAEKFIEETRRHLARANGPLRGTFYPFKRDVSKALAAYDREKKNGLQPKAGRSDETTEAATEATKRS